MSGAKSKFSFVLFLMLFQVSALAQQESGLVDGVMNHVDSCAQLLKEIQASDCGSSFFRFLEGGNISLGATVGAYNVDIKSDKKTVAKMGGENGWAPHYAINTAPRYFDGSNFGYDFSFAYAQSATTHQVIRRSGKDKSIDLGTYAIGNLMATQANLFYSFGAHDETPNKHFTVGVGLGLGYASVKGQAYLTEQSANNASCYAAGTDLHQNDSTALLRIKQNCTLTLYDRWGLGGSVRALLNYRHENYNGRFEVALVNLGAKAKLVAGQGDYDLSPTLVSLTLDYLFNVF